MATAMMRALVTFFSLLCGLLLPSAAQAGEGTGTTENAIFVEADREQRAEEEHPFPSGGGTESASPVANQTLTWIRESACGGANADICLSARHCSDGSIAQVWLLVNAAGIAEGMHRQCATDPPPPDISTASEPTVTPARVLRAFRAIPLPASDIIIQPGGGETLVNHPTFYRTEAAAFEETVTFFGGRMSVVLHIEPTSFRWNHGDGTTATTAGPGAAYNEAMGLDYDHLVFHQYAEATKGVPASVDTTWSATWTLNGRDMGAVPGTVTMDGSPQTIDIFEARPVLVS